MFSGMSAFPLTPMNEEGIDESAFLTLIQRLVQSEVDSIGVLGSTGSYAYLTIEQRMHIAKLAIEQASGVPVIVGVSALRTKDVLTLVEDADKQGASAVLLAPMSYQKLSEDDVYQLYQTVSEASRLPICVYDNPATTHFEFSDDLYARISLLENVCSIKIPGVPTDPQAAKARVKHLRSIVPSDVSIGVSGDAFAANGLNAGCDVWYSVVGGLYPKAALSITRAAQSGHAEEAVRLSEHLQPLWEQYAKNNGSLRVIASAAELEKLVKSPSLPLPLRSLEGKNRSQLARFLAENTLA
ncbi:dihydrodipicolinate synthase family protein [uncultured Vibrio sp.]|uniref:dihydrodipicolinate synthase family protein n=1 Tax=uncultured Vibrio sp. TaxID=114054 RepID=UPI0025D1D7A3|nr:dihydrodipicolinate synthase family protein [uncultured Vibrio sp.]